EKVALALKELGYQNITNKVSNGQLRNIETNAVYIGSNIALNDVKVITLALIRAGFEIKEVRKFERAGKENKIEIIGSMNVINKKPLPAKAIFDSKELSDMTNL